jgi:hypothetical protein
MAEVTVNFDSKAYTVDNGVNKKAFKFDNIGGGSQRTFYIKSMNFNVDSMTYQFIFQEKDTDEVNGYESSNLANVGVGGIINPAWITAGKLDLKLAKVNALNALFLQKLEIEPLEDDGTVKVAYI